MSSSDDAAAKSHHLAAVGMLLVTAVLWSLGGVLIKLVEWNPIAIAATRSAIAIPIVLGCAGLPRWPFSRLQWAGALAYFFTLVLFVAATRLTTAANAIFLQYTAPIYVALLAPWLLGEPSRRSDWIAIIVAVGGIALFFLDRISWDGIAGNLLAVLSGVSFAAMALLMRKERAGAPMQVVLLGNIITAVVGLPVVVVSGSPDLRGWLALALLGILQLGIPYVLYSIAIRRVTALEATFITLLEPILNPVWVMLTLGEAPGRWAVVGAAMVVLSVLARAVLGVVWSRGAASV